jgi:hypothetical protein
MTPQRVVDTDGEAGEVRPQGDSSGNLLAYDLPGEPSTNREVRVLDSVITLGGGAIRERLCDEVRPAAMTAVRAQLIPESLGEAVAERREPAPMTRRVLDGHGPGTRDLVVEGFPSRDDQVGATLWTHANPAGTDTPVNRLSARESSWVRPRRSVCSPAGTM